MLPEPKPKCHACDSESVCGLESSDGAGRYWCYDHAPLGHKYIMDLCKLVPVGCSDEKLEQAQALLDNRYPGLVKGPILRRFKDDGTEFLDIPPME